MASTNPPPGALHSGIPPRYLNRPAVEWRLRDSGRSKKDLAGALNVHPSTLSRMLAGTLGLHSEQVARLSVALDMPIELVTLSEAEEQAA